MHTRQYCFVLFYRYVTWEIAPGLLEDGSIVDIWSGKDTVDWSLPGSGAPCTSTDTNNQIGSYFDRNQTNISASKNLLDTPQMPKSTLENVDDQSILVRGCIPSRTLALFLRKRPWLRKGEPPLCDQQKSRPSLQCSRRKGRFDAQCDAMSRRHGRRRCIPLGCDVG